MARPALIKTQPERPPYDEVTIVVPGVIRAWKRVQVNRKTGSWYTDPDVETYQSGVRREAKLVMAGDPPLSCALELSFLAVWPVPDGWSNRRRQMALDGLIPKITRPDLENTFKGVLDALQMIVFRDDKQIVSYGRCAKIYGDRPRLEIRFTIVDRMPLALPSTPAFKQPDLFVGTAA
jgi:Holliday junction resolvase RusA-like endonuclease